MLAKLNQEPLEHVEDDEINVDDEKSQRIRKSEPRGSVP